MSERDNSSCSVREVARREFLIRWGARLGVAVLLVAISYGGYRGYAFSRQSRLERQGRAFFERQDYQSAALVARRLLQLDDQNVVACRLMAEMAEMANRPEAVSWRQRVAHFEPKKSENRIALAAAAVHFGQLDLAEKVLEGVSSSDSQSVRFHEIRGALALAQRQPLVAEQHFRAALAIDPTNNRTALNVAIVGLAGTAERADTSRQELARLTEVSAVSLEALRALTTDALARHDRATAQSWAGKVIAHGSSTLSDQLVYLTSCEAADAEVLTNAKKMAATSAAKAAELLTWMNRHAMAADARDWGNSLPEQIRKAQPVPLAIAESYSFLQDWAGLRNWITTMNWGECESLRLAVESHASHHLEGDGPNSTESQTLWRAALKAAHNRAEQLTAIAHLAEGWGYLAEAEEAWWTVANGSDNPAAALAVLQRYYKATQDTRGLLRVAKRAFELNPGDLIAANNCASLGLLLTGDSTARRLATKLYSEHPANAAFAATYAFALHLEGKTADALRVLQALKEEHLRNPAIAAYYFVMLVDNGQIERAKLFADIARTATLLPEEQQLLAAATRKLADAETAGLARTVARS
jgi:predicted Zn-dependent protease